MNGKLINIWNKVKEFFGKLSSKTKKLLIFGILLAIIFSVVAAVILNNKPYEMLFNGLNEQEASEIMGKLQDSGVPYKYEAGTIFVPKEQEEQLKAQLAFEGYPKSGFTYDVFKDNIDLMTTDFEKESYKLFELQDRIASTIRLFSGVKDAKVTIVLGEDKKYVLDSKNSSPASASVVVIMQDGGSPSEDQVRGIQRLVAKSIPQMEIGNVVILDGNGQDVTVSDDTTQSGASKLKIEMEKITEDKIKDNVLNMLNPIYGLGNVRVSVKATIDIDKKIRELVTYTPNGDTNAGVISSVTSSQTISKDGAANGGVPGTETNADIPIYTQTPTDGTENYINTQNAVDYLVNQLKEQSQVDAGDLKDLMVSVAINGQTFGNMTQNQLETLVARAAGITPDVQNQKIALVATPFVTPPQAPVEPDPEPPGLDKKWIIIGAAAAGGLLLLLLLLFILLRRRKKKKGQLPAEEGSFADMPLPVAVAADGVTPNVSEDLLKIKSEKGMELKEKIRGFAEENPEISAQLLKTWLRGGDNNG